MFSLIVFSLATFGAVNSSLTSVLNSDGGDGGWDVLVAANRNAADGSDVPAALTEEGAGIERAIEGVGRTPIFTGRSVVRLANGAGATAAAFSVLAADDGSLQLPEAGPRCRSEAQKSEHQS